VSLTIPPEMAPRPTLVKLPSLLIWRIRRGLAQTELAEQTGIGRANISRVENGGETHLKTARLIAQALDCTIDDLMKAL
jgi:transcriptional regulator with XRE-family HTH domain